MQQRIAETPYRGAIVLVGQLGFLFDGSTLYVRALNPNVDTLGGWDKSKADRAARKRNQRRRVRLPA